MSKISSSNTKAEILKAYTDLVAQFKEERRENTKLQKSLEEQESLLAKAKDMVTQEVTMDLKKIRSVINDQLDTLEEELSKEQEKFRTLQAAVATEKDILENLHKITTEAESLEALTLTHKRAKERLDEQMKERKEELQLDISELKQKWDREREAYEYKIKIQRRNDEDAYNQKKDALEKEMQDRKAAFDKEMLERENVVTAQEAEFHRLKALAEGFEQTMKSRVDEAIKVTSERLHKEFEYEQKLRVKDLEGALSLREQAIQNLEAKVTEQRAYIDKLLSRSDSASLQVKDIALKAIENSGVRSLNLATSDKAQKDDD